jgi:UDP-N-acetyl-alpha-D-quinovosamine dehydrogenase
MILVTGANGFVGRALHHQLLQRNVPVRAVSRGSVPGCVPIGVIDEATDWTRMLVGVDAIVHLAARVHVMHDTADNPLQEFRKANVHAMMNLARQAAAAGVRRFVLVSSIKVNGEQTEPGKPFRPDDPPQPMDPYGVSKLEAERALLDLARASGMEVAIVRPPLVYGPGVKANFLNMMKVLRWGLPLPLGAIDNRRSLVFLDNLVDLLMVCITHPGAKNQIFLAGDGRDLSTTELCRMLGGALGRPARLLPVPAAWIDTAAALLGKRSFSMRLCGSLQVDISKAETLLGWRPPVSVRMALEQTAEHFLASRERKGA